MGGGGWLKTSEYHHIGREEVSKIAQKTVIYLNVPILGEWEWLTLHSYSNRLLTHNALFQNVRKGHPKGKGKKKVPSKKLTLDCTHPVEDGIMDISNFVSFNICLNYADLCLKHVNLLHLISLKSYCIANSHYNYPVSMTNVLFLAHDVVNIALVFLLD